MFRKLLILSLFVLLPLSIASEDTLALQLFRSVVKEQAGHNIVFSPVGVEHCLEQLKEGTAGESARELQNLRLGKPFSTDGTNITPKMSSATFADEVLELQPGTSHIQRIPLSTNRQKALSFINNWCSDATQGRIRNLLSGDELSENSRLLLINTILLNEPWQNAFHADSTDEDTFTRGDGSTIRVNMMNSGETAFRAAGGKNWRAVALPYSKADSAERPFYFVAILPRADAQGFAQHLTQQKLDIILRKLADDEEEGIRCTVRLPRFSAHGRFCNLTPTLQKIGLKHIFTTEADFSPWSKTPGLRLTAVCQKACVEVQEHGTIAAAASYAEMDEEGENIQEQIVFNRPFLWLICELSPAGSPLFMGLWEGTE